MQLKSFGLTYESYFPALCHSGNLWTQDLFSKPTIIPEAQISVIDLKNFKAYILFYLIVAFEELWSPKQIPFTMCSNRWGTSWNKEKRERERERKKKTETEIQQTPHWEPLVALMYHTLYSPSFVALWGPQRHYEALRLFEALLRLSVAL